MDCALPSRTLSTTWRCQEEGAPEVHRTERLSSILTDRRNKSIIEERRKRSV
jgi:hypothetical protein